MMLRMFIKSGALGLWIALALGNVFAQEERGFRLEPLHATGMMETGVMVNFLPNLMGPTAVNCHGCTELPATGSEFIDHNAVFLLQQAQLSENIRVFLGVGGFYFYVLPSKGNQYSVGELSGFALTDAHGEFDFWKRDRTDHGLSLKVGVFGDTLIMHLLERLRKRGFVHPKQADKTFELMKTALKAVPEAPTPQGRKP